MTATTDTPSTADAAPRKRITVFSGAGISVAAGLATYRGEGGIWTTNPELEVQSSAAGLQTAADAVWDHIAQIAAAAAAAQPTAAHLRIAAAQQHADVTVITQNIDGLHQRAGSERVIELHGSVARRRCAKLRCVGGIGGIDTDAQECGWCGRPLRPDVVLFGEQLNQTDYRDAQKAIFYADHIIAVGTSGTVWPARELIEPAPQHSTLDIITTEPWDVPHRSGHARHLIGDADSLIDALFDEILGAPDESEQ